MDCTSVYSDSVSCGSVSFFPFLSVMWLMFVRIVGYHAQVVLNLVRQSSYGKLCNESDFYIQFQRRT